MTTYTSEQPAVNANIHHGNATLLGTESGWALPGGTVVRDETRAKMYARRMALLMTRLEVGK